MKHYKIILPTIMVALCILGLTYPVRGQPAIECEIAVEPQTIGIEVCSEFTIDIVIREIPPEGVVGFMIGSTWNTEQIEYVSHQTHLPAGWLIITGEVSELDGTGYIAIAAARTTGEPITENTSVITLTFHCKGEGSSSINIPDPFPYGGTTLDRRLIDPETNDIPHMALGGVVYQGVAVGGYYETINKIGILAPYLALVSLIGVVSALAIRRWRKA